MINGAPVKGIGEDKLCSKLDKKKGFIVGYYWVLLCISDQSFVGWMSVLHS